MSQPNKQPGLKSRFRRVHVSDVEEILCALRALDRIVLDISMRIYKIPLRDRAVMRKQNRWLHDSIRERVSQIPY